jgi:hypothetical protein
VADPKFTVACAALVLGGLWVVLALVIRRKRDSSTEEIARSSRQRTRAVVLGLIAIAWGISRLPAPRKSPEDEQLSYRPAISSQYIKTTDKVLQVRMPGKPEVQRKSEVGDLGLTKQVWAEASADSDRFAFGLHETHFVDTELRIDAEEYMDRLVDELTKKWGGKVTKTRTIARGPLSGRQVAIALPNKHTVTTQIFLSGRSHYLVTAVAPTPLADSLFVREYLYYVNVDEFALSAERKPAVFEWKPKADR